MIGIMATESADNEIEEINFEDISDEVMAVAESIDTAVRDAVAMVRATECLRQAIARKASEPELKQVMEMHRRVRSSLLLRYGESPVTSVFATEASAGGNLVMVREEEANTEAKEGDGFFTKLVDKIIAAFKWLWDKISSVFSGKKEESDKKAVEDAKTSAETLKNLKEVKNEPGTPLSAAAGVVSRMKGAGELVSFKDFMQQMTEVSADSAGVVLSVNEIAAALDKASLFSGLSDTDLTMEKLEQLRSSLSGEVLSKLRQNSKSPYKPDEHSYVFGKEDPKLTAENTFTFQVLKGKTLATAAYGYADGAFVGKMTTSPIVKEGAKLAAPSVQDANEFGNLAETYVSNLSKALENRKEAIGYIKKNAESTTSALEKMKKSGGASEAHTASLKTVQSIGSLATAFSAVLTNIADGASLINSIKDAILKTSTEGDKPKEEKPKEEAPAAS